LRSKTFSNFMAQKRSAHELMTDEDTNGPKGKKLKVGLDDDDTVEKLQIFNQERIVILNVGGTKYTTSLSTLMSSTSIFSSMFGGRFSMQHSDDGSFWIDRDPILFNHILNYLRTANIFVPDEEHLLRALICELSIFRSNPSRAVCSCSSPGLIFSVSET